MSRKLNQETHATSTVGAGNMYSSSSYDLRNYKYFMAGVYADVDGTLYIEESGNDNDYDVRQSKPVDANTGTKLISELALRYARAKFENESGNPTTDFRLFIGYKSEK